MLGTPGYITMSIQVVEGALLKGAILQNESALIYSQKEKGKSFFRTIKKNIGDPQMVYEGLASKEAVEKFVYLCGPFNAIGMALKWYRTNS